MDILGQHRSSARVCGDGRMSVGGVDRTIFDFGFCCFGRSAIIMTGSSVECDWSRESSIILLVL